MAKRETAEREDLAFPLARYVAGVSYADIPGAAIEATKHSILDTLGVILPASDGSVPGCREFVDLIIESSGKPESTILQFGAKVPAWLAAFANGGMAHALDYDDIYSKAVVHPSCMVVPAAVAAAERRGRVTGKELITAVTVGNDIACRMGLTIHWEHDWHLTSLFGRFACAAAAAKLMGLGVDQIVGALGTALNEAPGSLEDNRDAESTLRAFEFGFAARGGVLAALMAEKGIMGPRECLEGKASFYPVYFKGQAYDRDQLLTDLGRRFEGINVGFKPWPSCSLTHSYIGATLQALKEHPVDAAQIEEITVGVNEVSNTLFEPLEARRRPPNITGAKYSLPYTLAVAVLKGGVTIADYGPESLKDGRILGLAQKVVPRFDQSVKQVGGVTEGVVEIKTSGGKRYQGRVDVACGRPENPMSRDELIEKFRDCARHASKSLTEKKIDCVIDMLMKLEEVGDVREIINMLA